MMVSGLTSDGKSVVRGVHRFVETTGLPLDFIIRRFRQSRLVIDWADFVKAALVSGQRPSSLLSRVQAAVSDAR